MMANRTPRHIITTMSTENTLIHALKLGPMDNFVYVIEDVASQRAAVVDPAWAVDRIAALVKTRQLNLTDILLTHSHHDHINGVNEVLSRYDARLHLLKQEYRFWGQSLQSPALHHSNDSIALGSTAIEILHTPGHTPGSACYLIGDQLIAGDTMFVFGCGRCDLSGGDPEMMFDTLKRLKETLPDNTLIHPGHDYAVVPQATMAEQINGNPFMHFNKRDDFVKFRMHIHGRRRQSPYTAISPDQATRMLDH